MSDQIERKQEPFVKLPARPAITRQRLRVPYKLIEKQTLCRIINTYQSFTYENGNPLPGILSRTKWTNVVNDYNACFPERKRNQKQLRKCWENLKNRGLQNSPLYSQFICRPPAIVPQNFASSSTQVRIIDDSTRPSYQPETSSPNLRPTEEPLNMVHGKSSASTNRASDQPQNFSPHNSYLPTSQSSRVYPSTDLNVPAASNSPPANRRNVFELHQQRHNNVRNRSRPYPTAGSMASRSSSSPDTVKQDEEKVLRIKLLRSQILRIRQQMRQAEAVHDVTMRMLRTKASWFDKQMNEMDSKRSASSEFMRNDDKDCLNVPSFESEYDDLMSVP